MRGFVVGLTVVALLLSAVHAYRASTHPSPRLVPSAAGGKICRQRGEADGRCSTAAACDTSILRFVMGPQIQSICGKALGCCFPAKKQTQQQSTGQTPVTTTQVTPTVPPLVAPTPTPVTPTAPATSAAGGPVACSVQHGSTTLNGFCSSQRECKARPGMVWTVEKPSAAPGVSPAFGPKMVCDPDYTLQQSSGEFGVAFWRLSGAVYSDNAPAYCCVPLPEPQSQSGGQPCWFNRDCAACNSAVDQSDSAFPSAPCKWDRATETCRPDRFLIDFNRDNTCKGWHREPETVVKPRIYRLPSGRWLADEIPRP